MIKELLFGLFSPAVELIKGWQKRKQAKLESDLKIAEAKTLSTVERIKRREIADIRWENTSIDHSGWKDEFWTLIIALPLVMCFIPGLDKYALRGFEVLEQTPEWYRWAVGIAIGSAFGVRKFTDFMRTKKE